MSASGVQQHALHNNDPVNDPTAQRRQSDVMGNRKSSTLPSIGKTSSSSAVNRHELPDSCRLENVADEHPGGSPVNVDALHHHEQHPVASVACVNGSTDEHQLSLNNLSSSSNVNQGDGYERPDDCNLATSTNGGSTPSDFRRPDSSGEVAASAVEIVDRSFPVAEQIAETCVDDTRNGNSTTVTDCSTGSAVVGGSSESAAAETEGEPSTSADGVTALVVEVTEMKSDLSTSTGGDDAVVEASEDDVFENTSGTTSSTEETTATRSSTSSRLSVKRRPLTRAAAEIIRSPTPISELDEDFGSDGRRQSDDDVIDNRKINGLAGRRYQETDDITSAAITDDVNSTPDVDYNAAKLSDDVTMDGTDGLSTPSSALCSTPATATARFGKSMLGRRMESCLAQVDLERCDPSTCVSLLRLPAMKTYSALSRKLKSCDRKWMEGFLEEGGLDMLLKGVETVSSRRVVLLTDAMLLLECVNCVRCVMNSQIGLDVILQQPNYVQILVGALDMSNVMVKKQVFDLLSALCVYSDEGFDVIMDAVDNYKTTRSMHYRFSFLMSELRSDVCTPAYAVSIIAFINCLIVGHEDLQERIRVRNELIGLNFLEVIDKYRDVNDDELIIQCDVFYDEKQSDEDELATLVQTVGLDLNSHKDVFDVIYERVYNAPQSATLLNILHSLLQIDNQNKNCDLVWNTVDAAVSKAVLVSNEQQAHNFLSSKTNSMSFSTIGTQTDPDVLPPSTSVQKPMAESNPAASADTTSVPPPPPPPPPPMPVALGTFSVPLCPPPPPPPPPPPSAPFMMAESSALFKSPDESLLGCPPPPPPPPPPFSSEIPQPPAPPPLLFAASSCPLPPPPPPPMNAAPPPPPLGLPLPPPLSAGALGAPPPFPVTESPLAKVVGVTLQSANQVMRRAVTMPAPRSKMKTVNWTKLPPSAVSRSDAVWNEVNKMQDPVSVDYATLEQLFSKRTEEPVVAKQPEKKKSTEVNLLDTKRSMNINIFLKQFKMTNEAIVDLIRRGDDAQIGPEKLKGLMKLLPEKDEIESINGYDGDRSKLGNAEKFFASLISLVAYPTRIEAMLIKAEFQANVDALTPRIDAVIDASTGILDSKSFLQFLRVTLQTVNFINAGCYAGNAVGFRLSSLMKLIDTRSNKPRVTLLHYIVDILDSSKEENAFEFVDKLSKPAAVASKQTVEGLHSEVNLLDKGVRNITKQILNIKLADVTQQFSDYFNKASTEVKNLQDRMEQIEQLSHKLAQRFCEDEKTFKVEEFLQTFNSFCELVRQCQKDNENRRIQEEKAAKRKLLEEQKLDHKTKENDKKQTTSPDDECIIDKLLCEIRRGTSLRRRTSNVSRRRSRSSSRGQTPQRELPPSPFKSVGGSSSDASSIVACGGAT